MKVDVLQSAHGVSIMGVARLLRDADHPQFHGLKNNAYAVKGHEYELSNALHLCVLWTPKSLNYPTKLLFMNPQDGSDSFASPGKPQLHVPLYFHCRTAATIVLMKNDESIPVCFPCSVHGFK
jgi:hypothetical protein